MKPIVTVPPISQTVVAGGMVSLSAIATGHPLPLSFRWLNGTTSIPAPPIDGTNCFLTLTNVQPPAGTNQFLIRINVTNPAGGFTSPAAIITVLPDGDHDGLPDSWESGRPGFSTTDPSDALRDDDGDGLNNAREYFAGTDYLNRNSYLRSTIQVSGNTELTFQAVSNRTYVVQYNETLNPAQWVNLAIEPGKTNTRTVIVVDPTPRPKRYYRLVTPAQP